jgi:glycosyltransferase involved in cell wall biosynthesis
MSYAIQQAMAHGKPVVAYDTGANREAIIHNETGLLAEWGNIEQLTSHVRSLLLDERAAKRMGDNARKLAEAKFSIEQMTKGYEKLIEEITQTRT